MPFTIKAKKVTFKNTLKYFIFLFLILIFSGSLPAISLASPPATAPPNHTGSYIFDGTLHTFSENTTSQHDYIIDEYAMVNINNQVTATWLGTVSNTHGPVNGLAKLGAGTLVLNGLNTYRGPTLVVQGSLHLDNNQAAGFSALRLNPGTRLQMAAGSHIENPIHAGPINPGLPPLHGLPLPVVAPSAYDQAVRWDIPQGTAEHAGPLTGGSPLIKQGAGTLVLSGDGLAYSGEVTIEAGTLAVNDYLLVPINAASGSRLQGTGTTGSVFIQPQATLAPGSSIGTLTVNGDLHFASGAHLEIEAQADGQADQVRVHGLARLDGNVQVLASDGHWQPHTRYLILQADGGLDGTQFAAVSSNLAFLSPELHYDASTVSLHLNRNDTPLTGPAETPEEHDVADTIEQDGTPGVYEVIVSLDAAGARTAYQQLPNSWAPTLRTSLLHDSYSLRQAALAGMASHQNTWGQAWYRRGKRQARGYLPAPQYHAEGFATGGQTHLGRGIHGTLFIGAQNSRARQNNALQASASTRSFSAGLGLAASHHALHWQVGLAHTWHTLRASRQAHFGTQQQTLGSRYPGRLSQLFGEAVLNFSPTALTPAQLQAFSRLALLHAKTAAFTETGGSAALHVNAASQTLWQSTVGIRLQHTSTSKPTQPAWWAQLAWEAAGGQLQPRDTQRFASSPASRPFTVSGLPYARHTAALQLGVNATISKTVKAEMVIDARSGKGIREAQAHAGLHWQW